MKPAGKGAPASSKDPTPLPGGKNEEALPPPAAPASSEVPPVNYIEFRILNVTNVPGPWTVDNGPEPEFPEHIFRYEVELQSLGSWAFKHTFKNGRMAQLVPPYTRPVEETQLPKMSFSSSDNKADAGSGLPTIVTAPASSSSTGSTNEQVNPGITWWFHPDAEVIEVKDDPKAKKDPKKAPPKGAAPEPADAVREAVKPNSAYPPNYIQRALLSAAEMENLEDSCEKDQGLKFTFRRVLKAGSPADWEDANETRYRAEGVLSLSPFKEPGVTSYTYNIAFTPYVEPVVEETDKKGGKKGKEPPKKSKGGMPPLLTLEEVADGEAHPFIACQTTLQVRLTVALPLTKLPQNRPRPNILPNDLIPRRMKPQQRPMDATKMFAVEVSEIVNYLVREFRQFVQANSLPVEGEETRKAFFQFLSTSGQGYSLKEKLLPFVQRIVREKFNKKPGSSPAELDKVFNELYVYLLEHLHITLSKVFSSNSLSQRMPQVESDPARLCNRWKRLADEAELIQEFALASRYHQERLVHGPEDSDGKEALPDVWCEYAEFCLRVRDAARAEQAYREAIAIDIGHTPSLLGYGLLLLSRGRYKESEVYLQSAVDCSMDSVVTWAALALFHECHDQLLGTVGDEDNGNRRAKSQREANYCLLEAARHISAEDAERGDTPYYVLAQYLIVLHLEELALICLKHPNKRRSETSLAIGRLYYQTMQYEEAASQVQALLSAEPESFDGHILFGDILAQENKSHEAEAHYERALRTQPEGARGGVYVRLGNIYMTLGRYKEAKDTFITGVRVWSCGLTWMGVGIAYYRMDDYVHAEQALNESNILNNQNPKTWAYLALCSLKTGRDEEADFALNQALKLHLGDVDLLCEVGVEEQALGRLKLCEGIFRKCVSLKETYSTTLLLAQTFMALRMWDEAHDMFAKTLRLASNETENGYVEEQLRLLTSMQNEQ